MKDQIGSQGPWISCETCGTQHFMRIPHDCLMKSQAEIDQAAAEEYVGAKLVRVERFNRVLHFEDPERRNGYIPRMEAFLAGIAHRDANPSEQVRSVCDALTATKVLLKECSDFISSINYEEFGTSAGAQYMARRGDMLPVLCVKAIEFVDEKLKAFEDAEKTHD